MMKDGEAYEQLAWEKMGAVKKEGDWPITEQGNLFSFDTTGPGGCSYVF
jgi:hypothetical protein